MLTLMNTISPVPSRTCSIILYLCVALYYLLAASPGWTPKSRPWWGRAIAPIDSPAPRIPLLIGADHAFEYSFGIRWHAHPQTITSSRIWVYLRVFRPAGHVFENYFGVLRHPDAPQTISSPTFVCSANLTVPRGFFYLLITFLMTVSVDKDRWCPGDNVLANLSVPGGFLDLLNTFLRTISVYLDTLMPRRRFRREPYTLARNWLYLESFSTRWSRFRELFRLPRHADVPQTISSQTLVCSAKLIVFFFLSADHVFMTVSVNNDTLMPRR